MQYYPVSDDGKRNLALLLILAAAGVLAYLIWKKFKSLQIGTGTGTVAGSGNSGTATAEASTAHQPVTKKQAQRSAPLPKASRKTMPGKGYELEDIAGLITKTLGMDSPKKDVVFGSKFTDRIVKLADQLSVANREAAQFRDNFGTTPTINKVLAEINSLNDEDFRQVLLCYKDRFNGGQSYYTTNIAEAKLDSYDRVKLTNRVANLNAA